MFIGDFRTTKSVSVGVVAFAPNHFDAGSQGEQKVFVMEKVLSGPM